MAAIPPIRGLPGRPLSKPRIIQADRGYDYDKYRRPLHAQGIRTLIARRNTLHGSGLDKTRWVVERTISWLHNFRATCVTSRTTRTKPVGFDWMFASEPVRIGWSPSRFDVELPN